MALPSQIREADEAGRARPALDAGYAEARALALIGSAGTTAEQDRAAAETVGKWARDEEDLEMLLEMLGLAPAHPVSDEERVYRASVAEWRTAHARSYDEQARTLVMAAVHVLAGLLNVRPERYRRIPTLANSIVPINLSATRGEVA